MLNEEEKKQINKDVEDALTEIDKKVKWVCKGNEEINWLIKLILDGNVKIQEDAEKIRDLLRRFEECKKSSNFKSPKEFSHYKTDSDLYKAIEEYESETMQKSGLDLEDQNIIINESGYKVIKITNFKKSGHLLQDSNWCVRHKDTFYKERPPFYLFIKNAKLYCLIHFNSAQCKDVNNSVFEVKDVGASFAKIVTKLLIMENDGNMIFGDFIPVLIKSSNARCRFLVLSEKPSFIEYVKNPTEEEQIEVVKKDHVLIRDLYVKLGDGLSRKAVLEAMKFNKRYIKYLKNPTEEEQLDAVKSFYGVLGFIKNPSYEVQLEAIKKDPFSIINVDNPSEELQLESVKRELSAFEYIKKPYPSVVEYVKKMNKK